MANNFESELFHGQTRKIELAGTEETILDGTSRPFDLVAEAFADVDQIAVIGWSSQGPSQARNLRESLAAAGSDTRVVVGLREGSASRKYDPKKEKEGAEDFGFTEENRTLLTVERALGSSGMSIMLIEDTGMVRDGHTYTQMMPEGATLGLSHGFWLGHLEAQGEQVRDDISVVGVCPKGMGPSVRKLYEQGSGINSSYALTQGDQTAREQALAWSIGIGAPYTFQTTLENEWRSDVFGERAILLGGVHGILEATYAWKRQNDVGAEEAYLDTVESLVGPISQAISSEGLMGVLDRVEGLEDKGRLIDTYSLAYPVLKALTSKIYLDVSSGREISEVVSDNTHGVPMTKVDGTDMWRVGERVRKARGELREGSIKIDPVVAGIYLAGMVAQVDILRENNHDWSEVVNESVIEAVDSLNPFMKANGVAHMVDNCSVTARRGSRKWAPLYQAWIQQGVLPHIKPGNAGSTEDHFVDFLNHDVHGVLKTLSGFRPPIDIAV